MKKLISLLLIACVLLTAAAALAEEESPLIGQPLPDFTVETIDGKTFTLSEILQRYDLVYLNLWASWCGPCQREFPFLEEAYQEYMDRVGVFALSVEPKDTLAYLKKYAQMNGLTFAIGRDEGQMLAQYIGSPYIPVSVVADKAGVIQAVLVGSQPDKEAFTQLFDQYLPAQAVHTVRFVDAEGNPVPGGAVNFCTDDFCQSVEADGEGVAVFAGEPMSYHVDVTQVPAGYTVAEGGAFNTEIDGGEYTVTLEKQQ